MDSQRFEFDYWLPFTARLPLRLGLALNLLRGSINYRFDREWRSYAVGQPYIKERVLSAMATLSGWRSESVKVTSRAQARFAFAAVEEWQAQLIISNRLDDLAFKGYEHFVQLPRQMIIATMHFDSPMLGLAQLGRWGHDLSLLTSNIVEDHRVHPSVRNFFAAKYQAMSACWPTGACAHKETALGRFVQSAKRGASLAVLCDVPANNAATPGLHSSKSVPVPFLGANRCVAPAVFRFAETLRLPVVGMVCQRLSAKNYQFVFSEIIDYNNRRNLADKLYGFFTDQIQQRPQAWWASDLLDSYRIVGQEDMQKLTAVDITT